MSRTFNLFRLQQVDSQLDRGRVRLAEIEARLAGDAEVRRAGAFLKQADSQRREAGQAMKTAEENTLAQRLKIEQTENHLYSGKVSHPKELQDRQNEVAALKRYLETLEDRQLEAMLVFEDTESAHAGAREQLDKANARKLEGDAALLGERTRLQAELTHLESERTVALIPVAAEDRAIYENLRRQRSGVAVAEAAGKACSACGTTLNASLYQATRSPSRLAFCDTCGRILYAG